MRLMCYLMSPGEGRGEKELILSPPNEVVLNSSVSYYVSGHLINAALSMIDLVPSPSPAFVSSSQSFPPQLLS